MFEYLKEKYDIKFLTIGNIKKAVVKTWITTEEFKLITGQDFVA
ncbi:XkdX family protein [Clostridium estertheticum]|nr:XkdX family protein [Clostridium estertheticum]MCB2309045.1 XkdX family protein [Clostridium estertheticum]MCB2346821.1 XkdX family protein [Clostridium estertheticum]MCB2351867.1 XkdX family protein [Clostridium estertheticum]WAG48395.1 XkdX family protein [Clostridium estertheticum]